MKRLKHMLLSFLLVSGLTFVLAPTIVPVGAYADSKATVCDAIGGCTSNANGGVDVLSIVKTVVSILSVVVGIAAVIMIIVAGLRFIQSGGDASKVAAAKNAIIYAIVGLVVVSLAQVIIHFVLSHAK